MTQKELLERLVQVTKRPTPVQQAPQQDSTSMYLLKQLMDKITWVKGDTGERGLRGYSPKKGIDYFDGKDGYTPVKGVDYFDGKDGKSGNRVFSSKNTPSNPIPGDLWIID